MSETESFWRPIKVTTPKTIEKIPSMVLAERRLKVSETSYRSLRYEKVIRKMGAVFTYVWP